MFFFATKHTVGAKSKQTEYYVESYWPVQCRGRP